MDIIEVLSAKDVIAIVLIIGLLILIGLGFNSHIAAMLTLIIGYYFGRRDITAFSSEKKTK